MTIAVEPMVCQGGHEYFVADNDWTVCTRDGKLAAHYENTVLITNDTPVLLTLPEEEDV